MKKQLLLLTMMALALPLSAQNTYYVMEVENNKGNVTTFKIDDIKEVRFKEKEEDDDVNPVINVRAQYDARFVSIFGQPSPNQDWGFHTPTRSQGYGNIRIIAEELLESGNNDFDFNDAVFDVEFISNNEAKITLLAAGGTLPMCIGDTNHEIHQLYGVSTSTMVNTGLFTSNPVTFSITGNFNGMAINIPIMVKKSNGEWLELSAFPGEPASKIAVTTGYEWSSEHEIITMKYPSFKDWVADPIISWY
jgi:hypothetical protein